MSICLYGSGSSKIGKEYKKTGYELGKEIAKRGHKLVFGGGSTGMMGAVSKGVIDNDGKAMGIAPEWMGEYEGLCPNCDEFIHTSTMDERKRLFLENSEAFIISPGGVGTLDEFFEILTLKKLDRHNKPIVIFNINHFYDTMEAMIDHMVQENVVPAENKDLYKVTTTVEETLDYLETCNK